MAAPQQLPPPQVDEQQPPQVEIPVQQAAVQQQEVHQEQQQNEAQAIAPPAPDLEVKVFQYLSSPFLRFVLRYMRQVSIYSLSPQWLGSQRL